MVTLYSQPGCQPCRMTARALDARGVDYQVRDVRQDPEALAEVEALGYQSLPVVVAGDTHWYGFRPDLIGGLRSA